MQANSESIIKNSDKVDLHPDNILATNLHESGGIESRGTGERAWIMTFLGVCQTMVAPVIADLLHCNLILSLPQQLARLLPAEFPRTLGLVVHIDIAWRSSGSCRRYSRDEHRSLYRVITCCVRDDVVCGCLTLGGAVS